MFRTKRILLAIFLAILLVFVAGYYVWKSIPQLTFFDNGHTEYINMHDNWPEIDYSPPVMEKHIKDGAWDEFARKWLWKCIQEGQLPPYDSLLLDCKTLVHPDFPDSLCERLSRVHHLVRTRYFMKELAYQKADSSSMLAEKLSRTTPDSVQASFYRATTAMASYRLDEGREKYYELMVKANSLKGGKFDGLGKSIKEAVPPNLAALYLQYPFPDSTLKYLEGIKKTQPAYYSFNILALWQKLAVEHKALHLYNPDISPDAATDSIVAIIKRGRGDISKQSQLSSRELNYNYDKAEVLVHILRNQYDSAFVAAASIKDSVLTLLDPTGLAIYSKALAMNGKKSEAKKLMVRFARKYITPDFSPNADSLWMPARLSRRPYINSKLLLVYSGLADAHRITYEYQIEQGLKPNREELDSAAYYIEKSLVFYNMALESGLEVDGPNGLLSIINGSGIMELGCYAYQKLNKPENALRLIERAKTGAITKAYQDYLVASKQKRIIGQNIKSLFFKKDVDYLEVQRALPNNTVFIDYLLGNDYGHGVSVQREGKPKIISLGNPDSIRSWAHTCKLFLSKRNINRSNEVRQFIHASNSLYKHLIVPFDIKPGTNLIISPDGALLNVGFESILTAPEAVEGITDRFHSLSYLIKKHPIRYAYSGQIWLMQIDEAKGMEKLTQTPDTYLGVLSKTAACGTHLKDLEYKNSSLNTAKTLWHERASIFRDMTKPRLLSFLKNDSIITDILQIQVHGSREARRQHEAFWALSCTNPLDTGLQKLYSSDILNMNITLRTKLLVLSACGSGQTLVQHTEGLSDMGRCFMVSMRPPTLYSGLWDLNETSTNTILSDVYSSIATEQVDFASALHQAKLNYLKTCPPKKGHPYFWSGIVMYGANGSL